jgi:hypothetical protein
MEQWVLLYAAGIAAVATIGVAIWNSRGESAELRQLKAMNEVLAQVGESAPAAEVFADARNGLLVRAAAHIATAPRRRRVIWISLVVIVAVAGLVIALWLWGAALAPIVVDAATGAAVAALITAVGVAAAQLTATRSAKRARERSREMQKEVDLLLANWFSEASRPTKPEDE